MDIVTYALCKKMVGEAASVINDMSVEGTTLHIQTKDGKDLEVNFPTPEDGVSITSIDINDKNHLICTMSNNETIDAGEIPGYTPQKGVDYYTEEDKEEIVSEVAERIDNSFTLDIV